MLKYNIPFFAYADVFPVADTMNDTSEYTRKFNARNIIHPFIFLPNAIAPVRVYPIIINNAVSSEFKINTEYIPPNIEADICLIFETPNCFAGISIHKNSTEKFIINKLSA